MNFDQIFMKCKEIKSYVTVITYGSKSTRSPLVDAAPPHKRKPPRKTSNVYPLKNITSLNSPAHLNSRVFITCKIPSSYCFSYYFLDLQKKIIYLIECGSTRIQS